MPKSIKYTPNVGKIFNLTKSKKIYLNPKNYRERKLVVNNQAGDKTILVIKELSHTLDVLYENKIYSISRFYLGPPVNETINQDDLKLQALINEYFSLISKNTSVPEEFVKFGTKLKTLQENLASSTK